ncbi:hypothetical protein DPMN_025284 [Dreissena polymorpha]|uniref:Uncharacterized protein n=1 Tax=Dreissena polymorpha TaxID=45954 RepID=A0A9D4RCF2_DREPO|nr:hypothetical protein DPMN_025284 [Dreissena polymorpha]
MSDFFHTDEEISDINTVSASNSDSDLSSDTESQYSSFSDTSNVLSKDQLTNELEALKIMSCFRRHNLTTSACKDIINTVKSVCNDSKNAHMLNYDYLMTFFDSNPLNEVHYCEVCCAVFPKDLDIFQCCTINCEGLRYKGPRSKQNNKDRQPRKCFIIACSYVLYGDSNVECVAYFVINTDSGVVYAVLEKYDSCEDVQLSQLPAGKHLVTITATGIKYVITADSFIDTLVYIKVCPEVSACISLMPSTHGHAIFK